jgi:hypothetical protein
MYMWRWDPRLIFPPFSHCSSFPLSRCFLSISSSQSRTTEFQDRRFQQQQLASGKRGLIVGTTLPLRLKELDHEDWELDPTFPMVDSVVDLMESSGLAVVGSCNGARGAEWGRACAVEKDE